MSAGWIFLAVLSLAGSPAIAADKESDKTARIHAVCESAAEIQGDIESCTDNVKGEKRGEDCRSALLFAWQGANSELKKVMSLGQKNLDTKQQADFLHSHADMQLAINKLQDLIGLTEESADKIAQYPRVMFDNPYAGPGGEGSSNCYQKSFKAITRIVADLDAKAEEGRDALAAVDALREISQARDDGMTNSYTRNAGGGAVRGGIGSGSSTNPASDITGLKEDAGKRGAGLNADGKRSPSGLSRAAPSGGYSAVTGRSDSADPHGGGIGAKLDPSGVFSGSNTLGGAPIAVNGGSGPPSGAPSVADGLFASPDGEISQMKLAVEGSAQGQGNAASGAGSAGGSTSAVAPLTALDVANSAASSSAWAGSFEVAGAEVNLFSLVSSRYRATALFQEARGGRH